MRAARRPGVTGLAIAVAALAVYGATLRTSIAGGDAGELVAVAARLEIAHPPGYPLYTLLAHAAARVPVGTLVERVNAFSALCDAAAAGVLTATVVAATRSPAAGAAAGALFAFAPLTWTYATGAEVFPFHNLLVASLLALALRWRRSGGDRNAALAVAAVLGLGLAHHHTIVFYGAPLVAWMAWHGGRSILAPRRLMPLVATLALGLAWYLYLPLAARHATTLSWGDPTTVQGFFDHLLRRDYGTFRLAAGTAGTASGLTDRLVAWTVHTGRATLWAGAALALAGAWCWGTARAGTASTTDAHDAATRDWTRLLLACLAFYVVGFHALANLPVADPLYRAVTARFWQQADVAVFLLLGLGLAALARHVPPAALVGGGAALVATQLGLGWHAHARHGDDAVARYGRALLAPLPAGSLLLTRGDLVTNVVRYLQVGERLRPDVVVLDQELLTKPWYVARAARAHQSVRFPGAVYDPGRADGFAMRAFVDANLPTHPIAVYPEWKPDDASVEGAYELWPVGLASRVLSATRPPALAAWEDESAAALAALDAYGWHPLDGYDAGSWERVARDDVWTAWHRRAWRLLTEALRRPDDVATMDAARRALEEAAARHPEPPWYVDRNLGLAYERLALRDPHWRSAQLAAWRRYLAHAPVDDEGRAAIAATVARLASRAARE